MLSLHDLQEHFTKSLFSSQNTLHDVIVENKLLSSQRLQVYRNNIFITLTQTLHSVYPSIQRLVGDEFFSGLCHEYIIRHPSTSGDLHAFGERFADFIHTFTPAKVLPYLSEVAQLEWAYHETFHERRCEPFDFNALRAVPEVEYEKLKFSLAPASRLFSFRYPILNIWQLCQQEDDAIACVDLAQGGEHLLVIRRFLDVCFEKLSQSEFELLSAFHRGETFSKACEALKDKDFDIEACLQSYMLNNTLMCVSF